MTEPLQLIIVFSAITLMSGAFGSAIGIVAGMVCWTWMREAR